ncbi:DUF29 domain-containing protein [Paraburkholderia youngii]|uniref:DUF29 domain-containing protein n=1 Tax=Paraburkholderia youngii TaxID=2782701 RepID=UPI003D2058A2
MSTSLREIEDAGKSVQREFASSLSTLLIHLLKWQCQPSRHNRTWQFTNCTQRKEVAYALNEAPSLRGKFNDPAWLDIVWSKARSIVSNETGLDIDVFPEVLPWSAEDLISQGFYPE